MKKLNDKIKSTKDMDKINSLIDDVIEKTLKKVKLLEELRSSIAYENCEYIIRKTNSNQDGLIELSSTFYLLYKKLDNKMIELKCHKDSIDKIYSYMKKRKIPTEKVYREIYWEHIVTSD